MHVRPPNDPTRRWRFNYPVIARHVDKVAGPGQPVFRGGMLRDRRFTVEQVRPALDETLAVGALVLDNRLTRIQVEAGEPSRNNSDLPTGYRCRGGSRGHTRSTVENQANAEDHGDNYTRSHEAGR